MPGARVDRARFLRAQLRPHVAEQQVRTSIKSRPAQARVSGDLIDRIADSVIKSHVVKAAGLSFAAGIPGGFLMALTIPGDTAQFVWHAIVLAQKLAYLYGWPDLMEDDDPDDETELRMILLIGAMLGVESANRIQAELAKQFASEVGRRLPRQTLTKTAYFPVFREILKWFGIRLTKRPSPMVRCSYTYSKRRYWRRRHRVYLRPMARQLKKHLNGLALKAAGRIGVAVRSRLSSVR